VGRRRAGNALSRGGPDFGMPLIDNRSAPINRRDLDMGAMAEAIVAYAQPLFDQTDGSLEQMNKAMAIGQLCWNLAVSPEDKRDQTLREMRPTLGMDDDEFEAFRSSIIDPMIRRHQEMFPQMHGHDSTARVQTGPSLPARAKKERYPGTDPYAPCPCNSGKKYKFCCKTTGR
jgi:hypothetical protein